jgi:hypothetical protein
VKLQAAGGAHESASAHKFLYREVGISRRVSPLMVNGRHRGLLQTISISLTRLAWRHRLMARLAARAAVSQRDCKNRHDKIISISLLQLGRTIRLALRIIKGEYP